MKFRSIIFFVCLFFVTTAFAQQSEFTSQDGRFVYVYPDDTVQQTASGPNLLSFHNGSYESALERAKRENKLVFLDFYASWCGPCKQIEKEVFSDRAFANYVNKTFVTYKVNMDYEKGADFAEDKGVYEYLPVLMVVNSSGQEISRMVGFKTANTYLLELQKVERYNSYKR